MDVHDRQNRGQGNRPGVRLTDLEMSEMKARVRICIVLFCFALLPISPSIAMADEIVAEGRGASVTMGCSMEKGPEDQTAEAAADVSEVGSGSGLGTGKLAFIVAAAVAGTVVVSAYRDDDKGPPFTA
jgi:hypothetical protein